MKRYFKWLIGVPLSFVLLFALPVQRAQAQNVTVSFQTFYDDLSPYGQWVYDPQYGNVWVPNAGPDFQPYGTGGHWVMTEYGNTWVSDYPWGWAPFHYGRWTYDPYYGWVWVPGYEWGPAWVNWRMGDGYCGWAPLYPGYNIGVGFGAYNCPVNWWVFMSPRYIYERDCFHYRRGPRYNTTIINNTTIIHNTYVDNRTRTTYVTGPRAQEIQKVTNRPVPTYRIADAQRPGSTQIQGRSVNLFRPTINRNTIQSAKPAHVVRAPQAIGRPQPAEVKRPAFHSEMQRQAPNMRPATTTKPVRNEPMVRPQMNRPQPQMNRPQPVNRPEPQMNRPQPQMNRPQPVNRPEPQMNRPQPQMNRPQPVNRPVPQMNRPQPQMNRPQPVNRPEPQMNRPQPQMNRPMQAPPRPEPQMNRPQPQMNRPMQAPPRPEPQRAAPAHEAPPVREAPGRR